MFYVADLNMAEAFKGFLTRQQFHRSLGCRPFTFDATRDIRHAASINDGLYTQAGALVRGFRTTHRKLVIAQDCAFDGSPGQEQIKKRIQDQLETDGWPAENFLVIAIEPELEQWIWQDSPHVEVALRHQGPPGLRQQLEEQGHWPPDSPKPKNPKEVLEGIIRQKKIRRSSALYGSITAKVSVKQCIDPEFHALCEALREWFPPEANP